MSTNKNEKKKSETKNEVAIPQPAGGSVEGSIEMSDMVVPSLKLAAKAGEMGELFIPGSLVLNGEYPLYGARTDDRTNPKEEPVWFSTPRNPITSAPSMVQTQWLKPPTQWTKCWNKAARWIGERMVKTPHGIPS